MSHPYGLGSLRELGPYFVLESHDPLTLEAPWQSYAESLADRRTLQARVGHVRSFLATGAGRELQGVEEKVGASVMQLGMAARLLSPWIGLGALDGRLVVPEPVDLAWIPQQGSSFPLSVSARVLDARLADHHDWSTQVVDRLMRPLVEALGGSGTVLWGNVASSVNGAVAAMSHARPDLVPRAIPLAEALLAAIPVQPAYTGNVGPGGGFRRNSCCLIYRVADGPARAVCGDCVLATAAR